MKKILLIVFFLFLFTLFATPTYAHSGCCSSHGGVSGCGCADGTPLSNTCRPYYPECSGGTVQTAPAAQTYTPVPKVKTVIYKKSKPTPTPTPQPKKKKVVKKKVTKKVVKKNIAHKRATKPTSTLQKKK